MMRIMNGEMTIFRLVNKSFYRDQLGTEIVFAALLTMVQ